MVTLLKKFSSQPFFNTKPKTWLGRFSQVKTMNPLALAGLLNIFLSLLGGCYHADRLQNVGGYTPLTPTQDPRANPHHAPVHMPMPEPRNETYAPNSLWRTGSKTFFRDQRARKEGDILTVLIDFKDKVEFTNETSLNRSGSSSATLSKFLGMERHLPKNTGTGTSNLLNASSNPQNTGKSEMKRKETLLTKLAVTVTQMLPNGNLVILGRQEVRMNFEIRELVISGVVRPCDITIDNTVDFKQIAEARLSYGGRGEGMDMQKTPYGQQVLNQILPF